jgi:hypothetical protein
MLEFRKPIPVKTDIGDGMALYVRCGGTFANDIWAIVLENGTIRHFRSDQIRFERNATFNINPYESAD